MLRRNDPAIVKLLGEDLYKNYKLVYNLSRFGELFVSVEDQDGHWISGFNNVFEARDFIDGGCKDTNFEKLFRSVVTEFVKET